MIGVVTSIGPDSLSVKTPRQRNLLIMTTNTVHRSAGAARSSSDPNVGDRVVVEVREGAGGLLAAEVRYAPGAAHAR